MHRPGHALLLTVCGASLLTACWGPDLQLTDKDASGEGKVLDFSFRHPPAAGARALIGINSPRQGYLTADLPVHGMSEAESFLPYIHITDAQSDDDSVLRVLAWTPDIPISPEQPEPYHQYQYILVEAVSEGTARLRVDANMRLSQKAYALQDTYVVTVEAPTRVDLAPYLAGDEDYAALTDHELPLAVVATGPSGTLQSLGYFPFDVDPEGAVFAAPSNEDVTLNGGRILWTRSEPGPVRLTSTVDNLVLDLELVDEAQIDTIAITMDNRTLASDATAADVILFNRRPPRLDVTLQAGSHPLLSRDTTLIASLEATSDACHFDRHDDPAITLTPARSGVFFIRLRFDTDDPCEITLTHRHADGTDGAQRTLTLVPLSTE